LDKIQQDLDTIYVVLQGSLKADIHIVDRFEGILSSDFGKKLRELRNSNLELNEEFRLKAVAEVEMMLEQIELEIKVRHQ
jgi:hypothetical protein